MVESCAEEGRVGPGGLVGVCATLCVIGTLPFLCKDRGAARGGDLVEAGSTLP